MTSNLEQQSWPQDIEKLPSYTEIENFMQNFMLGISNAELAAIQAPTTTTANDEHANQSTWPPFSVLLMYGLTLAQFFAAFFTLLYKYEGRHCNSREATFLHDLWLGSSTLLLATVAAAVFEDARMKAVLANLAVLVVAFVYIGFSRCSAEVLCQ